MENSIHQMSCKVRISDSDSKGVLKYNAILQMLQEAATEHAQILGVDIGSIAHLNLGWAISKFIINIGRLPKWGERILISTWPSDRERICTYREFEARDQTGNVIITARSQWILFDRQTRRIAKMERLPDWTRIENKYASPDDFDILVRPQFPTTSVNCAARNDDIDLNGHVNNAVYIIWALESLPPEHCEEIAQIRINFLEEVMPHTIVNAVCQTDGNKTFHSLTNTQTAHECARINILWR